MAHRPPESGTPATPTSDWLTIPNLLSLSRIAATPLLAWLIVAERRVFAVVLLAVFGFTDWLDGQIARRTHQVSNLGVTLDPVSDRVMIMTALVAMMVSRDLPLWLGAPVLIRDVALSIAFLVLARRGFGSAKVRRIGKTATFALLAALPAILVGGWARPIGLAVFAVGTVFYYVAGYRYWQDARRFLEAQRDPFAP